MTLTPSGGENHIFPSGDLVTNRLWLASKGTSPHSVGAVENRGLDAPLRIAHPGIQLGTRNPHQAAGHVQPERMIVVFDDRINGIAGQAVPAGKSRDAAIFHPA